MKRYHLVVMSWVAAMLFLISSSSPGAGQTVVHQAGNSTALSQIDKELAETKQQKADADAAAAASRKEASEATKQVTHLRGEKAKAKTAEAKKEFDNAIAKAQADADRANAEAQTHLRKAEDRLRQAARLEVERVKYERRVKEEEGNAKNRKEADKLNDQSRKR